MIDLLLTKLILSSGSLWLMIVPLPLSVNFLLVLGFLSYWAICILELAMLNAGFNCWQVLDRIVSVLLHSVHVVKTLSCASNGTVRAKLMDYAYLGFTEAIHNELYSQTNQNKRERHCNIFFFVSGHHGMRSKSIEVSTDVNNLAYIPSEFQSLLPAVSSVVVPNNLPMRYSSNVHWCL